MESRLPVSCLCGPLSAPGSLPLLWLLLTSHGIYSVGSPQVRTRCFWTRPHHLPPRFEPAASIFVWCQLALPRRPSMMFLIISLSISSSVACRLLILVRHAFSARLRLLPPVGYSLPKLASTGSLLIYLFSCSVLLQGTCTPFITRP